ncbi:MAG: methyltransferase domain-containing protein [Acetobacteraceae bacterium]|nr:methyltransferase domain-containing protein [Acetobacteraceae bacterium]
MNEYDTILAIRLLLGRPPQDEAEVARLQQHQSLADLRRALLRSPDGQKILKEEKGKPPEYRAPLFLLQPPPVGIPWRLAPPSLEDPVTQLCTNNQIESPAYVRWCAALKAQPRPHRKQWEFIWILATLDRAGVLERGKRVLGFGCGREPLPSFFASRGMDVVATDAPTDIVAESWGRGRQYSQALGDLWKGNLVSAEAFERHVSFRHVDMNDIPVDLTDFDACWSACALEHLGSLQHGLSFIENSLKCLRPGGLAVHTTEFNLLSNEDTFESPSACHYRKRDIEGLLSRLAAAGHEVWPMNLHPGSSELDPVIDLPPYSSPHLKLALRNSVTTSIGIVVRKRALGNL